MKLSWARIATWAIAAVVGAAYGTAGTIAHAFTIGPVPLGLVLAIVGSGALLIAVRALTADRMAALATGIGLIAAVIVFSGQGPGGSVIVPEGELAMLGPINLGVVWMVSVPVLVAAVVLWPERHEVAGHEDADDPARQ